MNNYDRLCEIQEQMLDLLEEADSIVRRSGNRPAYEKAKAYWLGHVEMALVKNGRYIGGSMCTMDDTIAVFEHEDDEDNEGECEGEDEDDLFN